MPARQGSDKEAVERLRAVPLFAGCSDRELAQLAGSLKPVSFEAGRNIVTEGEQGVGLHIIVDGRTRVLVGGNEVRALGPGDFFGEIALLDPGPRTASVVADTPVETLSLSVWNFRSTLKEHPAIALPMLEEMARRVRATESAGA
jgi:CRP-like cAMP-binding protein